LADRGVRKRLHVDERARGQVGRFERSVHGGESAQSGGLE
jgi:hypothetical protein